MRYFLSALMLLWAFDAQAIMFIGGSGAAGEPPAESCATQNADVSLTTNNASSTFYNSNAERGQSWKSGVTGKLYSITLHRNSTTGYGSAITIRVGTSANLSTYLVSYSCSIPNSIRDIECVVPSESRPDLTSGTTYYMGMEVTESYNGSWDIARDSLGGYADGTSYYDTTKDWNLSDTATSDLYMITKMCAD